MSDKYLVFEAFLAPDRSWLTGCAGKERREEKGSRGATCEMLRAHVASRLPSSLFPFFLFLFFFLFDTGARTLSRCWRRVHAGRRARASEGFLKDGTFTL